MRQRIIMFVLAAALILGMGMAMGRVNLPVLIGAIIFFIATGVSFIRGTDALYLIAVSIMFSPEIGTGLATGRATGEGAGGVTVRVEDIILVAVGCGWLLRTAYQKRHFGVIRTPLNGLIAVYMAISVVTTLWGTVQGRVQLLPGIIHNLKYFEYFFLFFMILAHVRERRIISRIIAVMLLMFFFAVLYGYPQIDLHGTNRVCAPFDAEPNTFGGYMVLMFCIAFGILQVTGSLRLILVLSALLIITIPPFLFTLSRASYMGMIAAFMAFLVFSPRRLAVAMVILSLTATALLAIPLVPQRVQNRIAGTFRQQRQYHVQVAGVDLDASTSARILSYQRAIEVWQPSPLIGRGVTGTHFIDSQYFRLLAEAGILGLGAFLLILFRLIVEIRKIELHCEDPFLKGATLGFLCGIFALMVHALSTNTFIIIRIAEPFWLMAGLLLLIPHTTTPQTMPDDHGDDAIYTS